VWGEEHITLEENVQANVGIQRQGERQIDNTRIVVFDTEQSTVCGIGEFERANVSGDESGEVVDYRIAQ
jgi:hypothetical protein